MAPLTPPSIDRMSRLKCVQDAVARLQHGTPESVFTLLQIVSSACRVQLCDNSFSLLIKAWPTMMIWIQHLYNDLHCYRKEAIPKAFIASRYMLFADMFTNLGKQSHLLVSKLLANDPGILSMMADMWIREGTDDRNVVNGFPCGCFFERGNAMEHVFLAKVISTCGTAEIAVHVACQRLGRMFGQGYRNFNWDELGAEMGFLAGHMFPDRAMPSPLAPAMHASSELASILMRAWAIVSSSSLASFKDSISSRDQLLQMTMTAALLIARSHDRILDVLKQGFFPILIKSFSVVRSSPTDSSHEISMEFSVSAFCKVLSPATVHRDILSLMLRGTDVVRRDAIHGNWGDFLPLKYPRVGEAWSGLILQLDERQKVYNKFKKAHQTVILCGNATVSVLVHQIYYSDLILSVVPFFRPRN